MQEIANHPETAFISYSVADSAAANSLCRAVEAKGVRCFFAPRDIPSGANFANEIVEAIGTSSALVVLVSASSVVSPHVRREISIAIDEQRPIIPFSLSNYVTLPREWRYWLSAVQITPYLDSDRTAEAILSVLLHLGRAGPAITGSKAGAGMTGGEMEIQPSQQIRHPLLPLSETEDHDPVLAVLPFSDLSPERNREYFSDGFTDDIITELSRFRSLVVIARNSSFSYKNSLADSRTIGRELGARYIMNGSVRLTPGKVRVTTQLAETNTGTIVWGEQYNRNIDDFYAVQDEIIETIVSILSAEVGKAETRRSLMKPPTSWTAYDYFLRGNELTTSASVSWDMGMLKEGRRLLLASIEVDSAYARAPAALIESYTTAWLQPLDMDEYHNPKTLEQAVGYALRAIEADPRLPIARANFANALLFQRHFDLALSEWARTFELHPAFTSWRYAQDLLFAGRYDDCVAASQRHLKLDPFFLPMTLGILAGAHFMARRYTDALPLFIECVHSFPRYVVGRYMLIGTYVVMGDLEAGRAEAKILLEAMPAFRISHHIPYWVFAKADEFQPLLEALKRAGIPE